MVEATANSGPTERNILIKSSVTQLNLNQAPWNRSMVHDKMARLLVLVLALLVVFVTVSLSAPLAKRELDDETEKDEVGHSILSL